MKTPVKKTAEPSLNERSSWSNRKRSEQSISERSERSISPQSGRSDKHPLNQKAMLAHYQRVYEQYNSECTRLAQQNRGGAYATGYRCLINFCKAYHEDSTKGFTFETSYALLAQDWGLSQSPKTIKRHLLRLSAEVLLLNTNRVGAGEQIALPLFNRLEEVRRKSYLNVKISLHPSFIVYCHDGVQRLHAKEYT